VQEGAIREVEEECSLHNLVLKEELCETWHTYIQEGTPMIKSTRWFHMEYEGSEVPVPQRQEGITEAEWLAKDNLDKVRKNTYPSVLDVIESYHT
jgi:hypothetical protein